jgi:hypothetical protein
MNRAGDDILTREDIVVAFHKFHKPSELKQTIESAGVVLPKLKAFLNMKRMRVTDLFNCLDTKNMGKITKEECKNGVKLLLRYLLTHPPNPLTHSLTHYLVLLLFPLLR